MINTKSENYKYFQNKKCEFFPCHKINIEDEFNCLFCFCPLYMLKEKCGGNFKLTSGVKDCSECTVPHTKQAYEYIMGKMSLVIDEAKTKDQNNLKPE